MSARVHPLLWIVAASALVAGLLTPAAAPAAPAGRTLPPAPVTWNGWRGVGFGTPLVRAHQRLGGTLHLEASPYGCGDVLTMPRAQLDGNVSPRPHRFGTILARGPLRFPLGIRSDMTPDRMTALVDRSGFRLHVKRVDPYGTGDYDYLNWVVGPSGRTLWFAYTSGDDSAYRIGLSATKRVAMGQLTMNGC